MNSNFRAVVCYPNGDEITMEFPKEVRVGEKARFAGSPAIGEIIQVDFVTEVDPD